MQILFRGCGYVLGYSWWAVVTRQAQFTIGADCKWHIKHDECLVHERYKDGNCARFFDCV